MSAKLGTMLSIFMIFITFLFGADLVMMQYIYTDLDSLSINASYLIAKNGYITESIKDNFLAMYKVNIYPDPSNDLEQSYKEGDYYKFTLEKSYDPIIISNSTINLKVNRMTIINFYN